MDIIARIYTDMPEKFGIPRQSGLVPELIGRIVFEPPYRDENAVKGIEGFSHLWLIWQFSHNIRDKWTATVRPPRLGGDVRMGVFATRSPFRPNPIGLSCVKLEEVRKGNNGPELIVSGTDMVDGTPIYDIKPYLAYTDSHPEATGGFAEEYVNYGLDVQIDRNKLLMFKDEQQKALAGILSNDPRPSYQNDSERIYGLVFAGYNVRFKVKDKTVSIINCQPYCKKG